jgi:hypothetical protein
MCILRIYNLRNNCITDDLFRDVTDASDKQALAKEELSNNPNAPEGGDEKRASMGNLPSGTGTRHSLPSASTSSKRASLPSSTSSNRCSPVLPTQSSFVRWHNRAIPQYDCLMALHDIYRAERMHEVIQSLSQARSETLARVKRLSMPLFSSLFPSESAP